MLHKMRRGLWWGRLFSIAWWLLVVVGSGVAYYYYLQPYVDSITHAYQSVQHGAAEAQNFPMTLQKMLTQVFQQMFGSTTAR